MAPKSLPIAAACTRIALAPFVHGDEGTLPDGPAIVAPNHSSFLDGPIIGSRYAWRTGRPLGFLLYDEPFRNPFFGWFLRTTQCIPFRRGNRESQTAALHAALARLHGGHAVGCFPEAHINQGRRLGTFRPGAALLALDSGAPIVPTGIVGSDETMPIGASVPRWGRRIRIRFGEALHFPDEAKVYPLAGREERAELVETILARVRTEVARLSERDE